MDRTNELENAMFCASLPCNPLPFLAGLQEYVKANGTASIQSDTAKRILYIVMVQAYGELASIDLFSEFTRLSNGVK